MSDANETSMLQDYEGWKRANYEHLRTEFESDAYQYKQERMIEIVNFDEFCMGKWQGGDV